MNAQQFARLRPYLTGVVLLAEWAHLTLQHLHGGVISHHILHRSDLPAISNWWGALLLPALTWFLLGRTHRRIVHSGDRKAAASGLPVSVFVGFGGALLLGILLSVAFTKNLETLASYLLMGALVLALFLPVYRAECLLGFVLGMSFTFGAVLPTAIGSLIAALSAAIHFGIHPLLARVGRRLRRR